MPIVVAPRWWRTHMLARFSVSCTANGIMLDNRDGDDREVTFHRVGIVWFESGRDAFHDVATPMDRTFRLGAGTTRRLPIVADPALLDHCRSGNTCRLVGGLTLESIERTGPLPLHATSTCPLIWGEGGDSIETQGALRGDDPALEGE